MSDIRPTAPSLEGRTLDSILDAIPERRSREMLNSLKIFHLVGSFYFTDRADSLREASKLLAGDYWDHVAADDLPVSVRSLSRILTELGPFFACALGVPGLALLVKRGKKPARLSQEAAWAWRENEAYLRAHLTADWFGFSLPAPTAARQAFRHNGTPAARRGYNCRR